MAPSISIFLDFNLPNATTWFYFSFLLAVALFFKFNRLLSVRNWDVVTVFLLVPGLLLLQQARPENVPVAQHRAVAAASVMGGCGVQTLGLPAGGISGVGGLARASELAPSQLPWFGYLWLVIGSGYFLLRCLLDLTLIRRPALIPNLNKGGLAWLAGALVICLIAVAYRQNERRLTPRVSPEPVAAAPVVVGKESAALDLAQSNINRWALPTLAIVGHLLVVAGLIVVGWRHFQDLHAGMAAATFYLMLPYTGAYVGQSHHVWPMALIIWALACYRTPTLAGLLMGLAAGTIYFPALLLPLWLGFYHGRGSGRFIVAAAVIASTALGITALDLWWKGELMHRLSEAMALSDWQPWKPPGVEEEVRSIWTGVHWAYRIPVFVAYLALVLTTALWPSPKNLGHVIALSAALLIGLQFWYADQGGVYVLWYLPLLLLLVFRPNLSDRYAIPISSEADWLARLGRMLARWMTWWVRTPEPAGRPQ